MRVVNNPGRELWPELMERPANGLDDLRESVVQTMKAVRSRGDAAALEFTSQFDGVQLERLEVSGKSLASAESELDESLKNAIRLASSNIRTFHENQRRSKKEIETMSGVRCWLETRPIETVGIYIPGGTAPLFSTVLMLAIPAAIAGCKEVVLCTPPNEQGEIHPAIRFAAKECGVTRLFALGGAQAVAAMAYGTESVPKVLKIFGPGNGYVTVAKQLAQLDGLAIDMPAGPSEVLVCADSGAKVEHVAADLLSQAEHGHDSQVVLVVETEALAIAVKQEVGRQLASLPRRALATQSLANSLAVVLKEREQQLAFVNDYAPEHLILSRADAREFAEEVNNAGSIFLGYLASESLGDYASGTNHTLPTYGYAKTYSGVNLSSFEKTISFQEVTEEGLRNIGPSVEIMAEAENLQAHKLAITLRLRDLGGNDGA